MSWEPWTAVCEGCDYEWIQLREGEEPPEVCPLCDSVDLEIIDYPPPKHPDYYIDSRDE